MKCVGIKVVLRCANSYEKAESGASRKRHGAPGPIDAQFILDAAGPPRSTALLLIVHRIRIVRSCGTSGA